MIIKEEEIKTNFKMSLPFLNGFFYFNSTNMINLFDRQYTPIHLNNIIN